MGVEARTPRRAATRRATARASAARARHTRRRRSVRPRSATRWCRPRPGIPEPADSAGDRLRAGVDGRQVGRRHDPRIGCAPGRRPGAAARPRRRPRCVADQRPASCSSRDSHPRMRYQAGQSGWVSRGDSIRLATAGPGPTPHERNHQVTDETPRPAPNPLPRRRHRGAGRSSAQDADVLFAARVSTAGEQSLEELRQGPGRSKGLINYLMRDRHGSPVRAQLDDLPRSARRSSSSASSCGTASASATTRRAGATASCSRSSTCPGAERKLVQEGRPGRYVFVEGTPEQHERWTGRWTGVHRQAYAAYQEMLGRGRRPRGGPRACCRCRSILVDVRHLQRPVADALPVAAHQATRTRRSPRSRSGRSRWWPSRWSGTWPRPCRSPTRPATATAGSRPDRKRFVRRPPNRMNWRSGP